MGILHRDEIYADMLLSAIRLERPGWRIITMFEHDLPWDISRNLVATTALNSGAEYCFFWDSDLVIPPYSLTRLVSRKLPIIGGMYYRRHPDVFPEVFKYNSNGMLDPVPRLRLEEELRGSGPVLAVDGIGAGCLLVQRRVLESMKEKVPHRTITVLGPPTRTLEYYEFYKWGIGDPEMTKAGEGYSEDLVFCVRARKLGWHVCVDSTVSCIHLTKMGIKDGTVDWSPLESGRG